MSYLVHIEHDLNEITNLHEYYFEDSCGSEYHSCRLLKTIGSHVPERGDSVFSEAYVNMGLIKYKIVTYKNNTCYSEFETLAYFGHKNIQPSKNRIQSID